MYALDDEKRSLNLQLDQAHQQVDSLQHSLHQLQSQSNVQLTQLPNRPTSVRAKPEQWDALLVRENDDLRSKLDALMHEKEQAESDRRNEREQFEMKLIEREVSTPTNSQTASTCPPSKHSLGLALSGANHDSGQGQGDGCAQDGGKLVNEIISFEWR